MKLWIVTEPMLWFFYILLVLELYSLILEAHKGLYTIGRYALWCALTLAVLSSGASLLPPYAGAFYPSRIMGFYLLTERGLLFSLVIFLLLILGFLSRYPVSLSRNVLIHSGVYSIFFLAGSTTFLIRTLLGYEVARPVNTALTGIAAACTLAWATLLSRQGEAVRRTVRATWDPEEEGRLIGQLSSLNTTLLRVARK